MYFWCILDVSGRGTLVNTIVLWHTAIQSRAQFYQLQNKVNFFFSRFSSSPSLRVTLMWSSARARTRALQVVVVFPSLFTFTSCRATYSYVVCRDIDWNRAHTVDAISCAAPSMVRTRGRCRSSEFIRA